MATTLPNNNAGIHAMRLGNGSLVGGWVSGWMGGGGGWVLGSQLLRSQTLRDLLVATNLVHGHPEGATFSLGCIAIIWHTG